jgi:hypothetical protein
MAGFCRHQRLGDAHNSYSCALQHRKGASKQLLAVYNNGPRDAHVPIAQT